MLKTLAIIPARKGSKRFPGKNTALLAGKPLVAHSIEYALAHMPALDILVSSDDTDVLEIGMEYGVRVEHRPKELSDDFTLTSEVVKYHANQFAEKGETADIVVLLQPTNPLRPKDLLWDAMSMMLEEKPESIISVSPLKHKFGRLSESEFIPENYDFGQRSQDIPERFYENGLLYLFSFEYALEGRIQGDNPRAIIVDSIEGSVDIDTEEDLLFAQFLLDRK